MKKEDLKELKEYSQKLHTAIEDIKPNPYFSDYRCRDINFDDYRLSMEQRHESFVDFEGATRFYNPFIDDMKLRKTLCKSFINNLK